MYELAALFSGVLIGVMVAMNGLLTGIVGPMMSVLIIHVVGLCTIGLLLLIRRKRFHLRAPRWWMYLAGMIGVGTTMLNNACYQPLGAGLMLALCVVGQIVFSSFIDHFGLFGMRVYRFNPKKLMGFGVMAVGLVLMMF